MSGSPVVGRRVAGRTTLLCTALLCAALLCIAAPSAAQARGGPSTNALLREAAGLEASGDLDGAERVLRQVLDREPRATGALFALERVLRAKGAHADVLPIVDAFLAADPATREVRALKLRVLAELDSLDAVRREAADWAGTDPSAATYRELATLYEEHLGAAEALRLLEAGREASGDASLLALEVGDLRARTGDLDGAVREWTEGVGDDGTGVTAVARRLRDVPDDRRPRVADAVLRALTDSPVFARRRAAALLALELRMEDEALALTQGVADELGGRARTALLGEVADRARDLLMGLVASWAYDELGDGARTPAERRAFDERLVEVSLAAGDTAAAVEAQQRIVRSLPDRSVERRQASVRELRLGIGTMDATQLRASLDRFRTSYPDAPEIDELSAAVSRALQARGDGASALSVLDEARGPRSASARAYLLLSEGRIQEGREMLTGALEGLSPSEATSTIRLVGLLGRLSPAAAAVLARAAAAAHGGATDEAVALLEEGAGASGDEERAALLAHAARVAEDAGDAATAARLRSTLLERYPEDATIPEAALALARYHAEQDGGRPRAIEILEDLIASRPNAAIVPNARAELARLRGMP